MFRIKNLMLVLFLLGAMACGEDFLDVDPSASLPSDTAIQSLEDMEAVLLGAYDQLQNSDYYGRYFVLVPDVMSDDVKQNSSANRAKEWAEYNGNPLDFISEEIWTEVYETINRANAVINADLELSADLQTRADQLVGEALALRALAHFDVCRIYAQHYGFTDDASHPGVPIVTQFEEGAEPTRSTVAQVYAAVIADMEAALTKMSEHKGTAFMSPIAVKALLTRIYFYQEEYQRVESLATEVIDSDETSLTATEGYVAAWLEAGSPPDVIFEVVMNENDNNGSDALGRMYINEGYGDYLPSNDLRLIIETDDLRSQLFEPDSTVGGGTFGWDRVNKYPATIGDDNTPVIRLAEIYLMRAEARARNGSAGAVDDLMTIRRRAWPDAPDVTATGDDLIEEIILERRIELAFEGNRLWDQMRLKRGIERTDCTAPICEISYPNDRFILPIPSQEIDANPNMTQNVGY